MAGGASRKGSAFDLAIMDTLLVRTGAAGPENASAEAVRAANIARVESKSQITLTAFDLPLTRHALDCGRLLTAETQHLVAQILRLTKQAESQYGDS